MSELTDDQLDGLFRKSAEEFETPFDSAAWQDMKVRLDTNDHLEPTGGSLLRTTILRWGIPTLLMLMIVGWIVYKLIAPPSSVASRPVTTSAATDGTGRAGVFNQSSEGKADNLASVRAPTHAVGSTESETDLEMAMPDRSMAERKTSAVPSPRASTPALSAETGAVPRGRKEESGYSESRLVRRATERGLTDHSSRSKLRDVATNAQRTTGRDPFKENRPVDSQSRETWIMDRAGDNARATPNTPYGTKRQLLSVEPGTTNERIEGLSNGSTGSKNDLSESTGELTVVALPDVAELAIQPAKWPKPVMSINRPVDVQPDTTTRKTAAQPAAVRGLSVRLVIAPDLSSVGLKNFARPGTNVGLLLEYRLSSHWSIQSGVIQSTKVYRAVTADYALPDYALKWTVKPEGVDGRCSMIDIPINIRYDMALRSRLNGQAPSRWFVSGGVTSYIMNQENYTYQYADPTSPHIYPNNRGWSGKSGGYKFSEVNLSAGYERAISHRLSWQVEPFMKVPLRRIGYLKLNLLSTGAFFSLRYKL